MKINWKRATRPTGCVLLIIAFNFAILGLVGIVSELTDIYGSTVFGFILATAFLLTALAFSAFALRPDPEYQELTLNSLKASEIQKKEAKQSPDDQRLLREVKDKISNALPLDEATRILDLQNRAGIQLANTALQRIAFAIKQQAPTSRYLKGLIFEVLVWFVGILSIPVLLILMDILPSGLKLLLKLLVYLLAISAVFYARRLIHRAKQYRLRPDKVLESDTRAPILYLRPFSEDYAESIEGYNPSTAEERLVGHLAKYGPPIAIGRPKEELPLPGAIRIYFEGEDTTWSAAVLYLMSVSQLVVIQAGFAEGLLWELGMARQRVEPNRLLISFHAWNDVSEQTRYLQYLRFKRLAEDLLGCTLPEEISHLRYLSFNHNWEANWC
ncbi:MAG: hypothetical protein M3362_13110 [Acidobacteriota bacterium]|nr:hypothetical protein [Acidobacteriota bacterium]